MRLSTPPLSPPRIIRASADEEDESITCSKAAGVKTSASMDFDMLFDAAEGASGANERMETVHEDAKDETYSSSDDDVLDPVSVYVRILKNLTRPKSAIEYAVYKRFKAACTAVGAGELGDAAYVDAIRSEFNELESDAWGEPQPRREPSRPPSTVRDMDHKDLAFVATTPGAEGHAALLNLRHSFLWIKLTDLDDTTDANATPEGTLHPSAFPALSDAPIRKSDNTDGDAVLLLEPDIKAHFVISRPTRAYQRLLDALPEHFVGTHKRLVQLVDFLCEQMLVSFRERGMSVPPWRKNKSILSKWFLPTATSRSHPASPTGSPETRRRAALHKQDSGRRMSLDVVGGGRVVGVGEGYGEDLRYVEPMTPWMPMAVGAGA